MLIIYAWPGDHTRAIYFDNEGHVINYAVAFRAGLDEISLVSDLLPAAPRFRLAYTGIEPDRVTIRFEIAPPGQPEAFSVYLQGSARRV